MTVFVNGVYASRLADIIVPVELSRKLRRADDYIRMAVAAAFEVTKDVRAQENGWQERTGLVLGSGFSTMQTNFEVLESVVSGEQTSPTLFSHSVFNAAAGYIASTLGIKGAPLTVTDFCFPFFKALDQAYIAVIAGRLDACLVLQVETYSDLLQDGRKKLIEESSDWQPGVVCLLLKRESNKEQVCILEGMSVNTRPCQPEALLTSSQKVQFGKRQELTMDPLGPAMLLAEQLYSKDMYDNGVFSVHSDWGELKLQFSDNLGKSE
jgi:hypothetical protein